MKIFFFLLIVFAGLSCAGKYSELTTDDLIHHRFVLENFNGIQIKVNPASSAASSIEFGEDMMITGVFCNNYSGQASLKDGKLHAEAVSTRKFCFDERLTQSESAFFKALSEGANLKNTGDLLTITHGGNVFVFRLRD